MSICDDHLLLKVDDDNCGKGGRYCGRFPFRLNTGMTEGVVALCDKWGCLAWGAPVGCGVGELLEMVLVVYVAVLLSIRGLYTRRM